jgi:penicillin-binding protein 1B
MAESDDAPKKPRARASTSKGPKKSGKKSSKAKKRTSWLRFLATEVAVLVAGVAVGAGAVSALLWKRADADVARYLEHPVTVAPGAIYSAPIEVRPGQALTPQEFDSLLLSSGYERADTITRSGQFRGAGSDWEVWTPKTEGPGFSIPETRVRIRIREEGEVESVRPGGTVLLRPTVLATIGATDQKRDTVKLAEVSPWMEKAVVAMEDQRFRSHFGVDPLGLARATVHNLRTPGSMHGGSTLTQQLAKNLFLTPERTLQRKVREVFVAIAIERRLGKDALLELYFREVYLGQSSGRPLHGVEQAAQAWFGVTARALTLDQAATIAGVISAPNVYSPTRHPEKSVERRNLTVDRMVAQGFLSHEEAEQAKKKALEIRGKVVGARRLAPWAVDLAVEQAEHTLGEGALTTNGYRVYTTIQPLVQRAAERAVRDGLAEVEGDYPKARGAEAALVALRASDGAIVAMVGGRDYDKSPFNRAADAWREVGSVAKPLTLLAAFDLDPTLHPLTRFRDEPISRLIDGKPWNPQNYDGTFRGEVSLRRSIEASLNVPAILLAERVGAGKLQAYFRDAGLTRASHLPSAALGAFAATPLEMASAYTVFPGGGSVRTPWLVRGVTDRDGRVILEMAPPTPRSIASGRAASLSTAVLEGVIASGTGVRAKQYGVSAPAGGKTGTTDQYRDAWFVGFTPDHVAAVWVGKDIGENLGLSGGRAALPTWARFMGTLPRDSERKTFSGSSELASARICPESEKVALDDCATAYEEWFPRGQVPERTCDVHGGPMVRVGNWIDNLLHRDVEPPSP